jgi:hypothetical protein
LICLERVGHAALSIGGVIVGSCVDLTKASLKTTLNVLGSGVKTTTSVASTGIEMVQNSLNKVFDWEKKMLNLAATRTGLMTKVQI